VPTVLALLCSVSRVADHFHHWDDVLAGGILGIVGAIFTVGLYGGTIVIEWLIECVCLGTTGGSVDSKPTAIVVQRGETVPLQQQKSRCHRRERVHQRPMQQQFGA